MNGRDRLRIAWLFPSMVRGNYWHPVLSEFTKLFQQTTVYTGFWPGFTPGFEGAFRVQVVGKTRLTETTQPLPRYGRGIAYASFSIVGHLLQLKPQVIFTSGFSIWTLLALLFKPWGRWKTIVAYEGSSPTVDCCDSKLRLTLRRIIVRCADAFITNNMRGKTYLTKVLGAEESRVFAQPYEVPDLKALSGRQENSEAGSLELKHPVFLYIGQLTLRKGLHHLLEACAILRQESCSYTVLIVGDGPQRDELEDFSQKHDLKDCIQWVRWVDYARLNTYFRSADVFVLPTLEDTWGMVVLEAMAFGKPILCSKWAGASEMVVNGENGFVFDPHEPKELAKIMIRFINEPELIASMGQKSQQMVARHTPEAAAQFLAETAFAVSSDLSAIEDASRPIIIGTLMREHGETGVQSHFNTFKKYLLEKGIEVFVITPFSDCLWFALPIFGFRRIIDKFSKEFSVWWYRYWHYIFLRKALTNKIQSNSSAIIYAQCPLSAKAALEARYSSSQKVILITHFNGSQADEWVSKGRIKKEGWVYRRIKQFESEILPSVDGIVYVSKFIEETIKNAIPEVAKVRSVVLPNFVVKPGQSEANITSDLISIGTLEPRKNQSYLLQVLSEAKKLGRRYSLTLIGDGIDRSKLKALAKSLDIDGQVKFMGFQNNAAQFLSTHRIYVHSALVESSPIALIEAIACMPLLAGAVGGIPEVFSDGVEGFYWPLDDPTAGAEKLVGLMEDTEMRNKMAKAGQARFSSSFDSSIVAGRLLSFLSTAYEQPDRYQGVNAAQPLSNRWR